MKSHILIVAVVILLIGLQSVANGEEQTLVLDCPVSKANPLFDIADLQAGAVLIKMERYRFNIEVGKNGGFASTPRVTDIPAQVAESSSHFQIDFENKRVIIDRMTAEFQVFLRGAEQPLGCGTCTKIDRRKF